MFNIYYEDAVNPSECLHTCDSLEDAKDWISHELNGYTMVDADHPCSEDVYYTSATAKYQVYDGDPVILRDDGYEEFHDPVYESPYFYTDL